MASSDTWRRTEELFQAALARPEREQRRFVEQAAAGDPDLYRSVMELLEADAEVGDSLEYAVAQGARRVVDATFPDVTGGQIGHYRLLRRIGEGGMGEVFLAARADREYDQQVALKVVRPAQGRPHAVERFRRERQILARLEHPNIARLLDGGTTEDGAPYLVMEYIEGLPIDEFCQQQRLSVRQRLDLFQTVCSAVHYAHQRLVIHRDLKPQNIFVAADGTVKLLDFGIAKLLSPDEGLSQEMLDLTSAAERLLTPNYASPEQIRGDFVGTASDVYSLGVVLFLLLTGSRPFQTAGLSLRRAEEVILSAELPLPSSVADLEGVVSRSHLRRRLAGDLDNIVLMALARQPEDRYSSVDQFGQDLSRHLEGLPVRARRVTLGYRISKFFLRHRVGAAVAGAFLALIVASGISLALQTRQVAAERDKAEDVVRFLVDLFEVSKPESSRPDEISALEILDQGAMRLESELGTQPETRALLLDTVGQVYLKLGAFDSAEPHLLQALELRRAQHGDRHPQVATTLNNLGWIHHHRGDHETAEGLYRDSLEIYEENGIGGGLDSAEALNDLAVCLTAQAEYEEAERLAERSVALYSRLLGADDPAVAVAMKNHAQVLQLRGQFQQAEELARQALAINQNQFAPPHSMLAADYNFLGAMVWAKGDLEEAEALHRKALEMRRQVLPPEHPDLLESINNVATALQRRGRVAEAEALLQDALGAARERGRVGRQTVAGVLTNLAILQRLQGQDAVAEGHFREALAIRIDLFGEAHPMVAQSQRNLAVLLSLSEPAEAEDLYGRALTTWRRNGEAEPDFGAEILSSLALLYRSQGRLTEALGLQEEALSLVEMAFGEESPRAAKASSILGLLRHAHGETEAAEPLLRRAEAVQRSHLPRDQVDLSVTLTTLGEVLSALGRPEEGEERLAEALKIRQAIFPPGHWTIAGTRSVLGDALSRQERFTEAEPHLVTGYEQLAAQLGAEHSATRRALERLVRLYEGWGRNAEAARYRARLGRS